MTERILEHRWVLLAGALMGVFGSLLAYLGNPANTGICISCFLENTAGALGLHANPRMQYVRPELLGFFLGSFGTALAAGEFRARARGAGLTLLGMGFLMAVGSAAFIGCPIKAALRLAAGDLTAVAGAVGLVAGVWLGLRVVGVGGDSLEGRHHPVPALIPVGLAGAAAVLVALAFVPDALRESRAGGGSLHAPVAVSLAAGLILGAVCQRSRFCITGSVRDTLLTWSPWPAAALGATILGAAVVNGFTGQFSLGYHDQPGAHLEWVWSLLGMGLVGIVAVLAGGCPFRQLIKAGEGDMDAGTVAAGLLLGAAVVQSWGLGATTAGVPAEGKVAVLLGLAAVLSLGLRREMTP